MYDKTAETLRAWDRVGEAERTVLLVGLSHTGRSTFAELVHLYQHHQKDKHPALVFEKEKYAREGVIAIKSIKIQTALPELYCNPRKD